MQPSQQSAADQNTPDDIAPEQQDPPATFNLAHMPPPISEERRRPALRRRIVGALESDRQ